MDLDVTFLGTAASAPTAHRGLPALLVRRGGERLLFDCGEGTQRQLMQAGAMGEIDDVFVTHMHTDHVMGLPGLLKTYDLHGRERRLRLWGPPGMLKFYDRLKGLVGHPKGFDVQVEELDAGEELPGDGSYAVHTFNVDHAGQAYGYALIEDDRPGRFDAKLAQSLGVDFGPDFGRLQAGETVNGVTPDQVIGPARPGRSVVVTGDSAPCEMTRVMAEGADLLVHEATFLESDSDRARETHHSTAAGAARLAAEAEVTQLALTHISSRYFVRDIVAEARAEFEATLVPRDFDQITVPFAESGKPELVRAGGD